MKTLSVFFLVVFSLVSILAYGNDDHKPYRWTPVPTIQSHGDKVYYDINGIESRDSNGERINLITLLTVLEQPLTLKNAKGENVTGSSIISFVVVDCSAGVGAPMQDFLLKEKSPTLDSVPVASKKYEPDSKTAFHLDKSGDTYQVMCPERI
jgi:hypothetical protein